MNTCLTFGRRLSVYAKSHRSTTRVSLALSDGQARGAALRASLLSRVHDAAAAAAAAAAAVVISDDDEGRDKDGGDDEQQQQQQQQQQR